MSLRAGAQGSVGVTTVFFDVDTQIDFLFPAGALYVPGAETLVERVAALNCFAASQGITVISTMDAHAEDDPEFKVYPHHCVAGTLGQHKAASTLLEKRTRVSNIPHEVHIGGAQQVLLEKQRLDCFTNVNLEGLLRGLNPDRYVVYGVVTEICVKCAAFGLLATGKRVEMATDAVRSLTGEAGAGTLTEFETAGGALTTIAQILGQ
jgi:nicotinamidase/pyrazinamidase